MSERLDDFSGIVHIHREPDSDDPPYFQDPQGVRGTFMAHRESEDGRFIEASPVESWTDAEAAITWGRSRAPVVVIRLGNTLDTYFSAGTVRAVDVGGPLQLWPPCSDGSKPGT